MLPVVRYSLSLKMNSCLSLLALHNFHFFQWGSLGMVDGKCEEGRRYCYCRELINAIMCSKAKATPLSTSETGGHN